MLTPQMLSPGGAAGQAGRSPSSAYSETHIRYQLGDMFMTKG